MQQPLPWDDSEHFIICGLTGSIIELLLERGLPEISTTTTTTTAAAVGATLPT